MSFERSRGRSVSRRAYGAIRRAGVEVKLAPLKLGAFLAAYLATTILADTPELHLRGQLPEPFDYFNHGTNFSGSLADTALYGTLVARQYLLSADIPTAGRARLWGIAVGAGGMALANAIWETRFGVGLVHDSSTTPDFRDMLWGLAGATLGAVVVANQVHDVEEVRYYAGGD